MSVIYDYDVKTGVVHIRVTDVFTLGDVIRYGRKVEADLPDGDGFAELVDLRETTEIDMSYRDALRIRELFSRLKEKKGYLGSVFLVGSDYQGGMARMFSTVLEEIRPVHVVRDAAEAEEKAAELASGGVGGRHG